MGELVRRWGGVATTQQLRQVVGRHGLEAAAAAGSIRRVARGRWTLASTAEDRGLAHAAGGVLSHTSAAHWHGWPVLTVDQRVHVTVPRGSRARQRTFPEVVLHWADLTLDEVNDSVTSRDRTLVDCLRTLDLRIALSVADSALREGYGADELVALAGGLRGRGAGRARRVAAAASGLADNPFESALRAISLDVPALRLVPQVPLYVDGAFIGRPDLVDERLALVVEADSFAWHGSRQGLVRDTQRYNDLVLAGWRVLRFTWEDVVLRPERVRSALATAAERRPKVA